MRRGFLVGCVAGLLCAAGVTIAAQFIQVPVPIIQGGTGATSAANARTNLGIVSYTDDPELAAIAALTSAADRLPYYTGSGTAALAVYTGFARTLADDVDAVASRATLGLIIGTDVQAFDAELAAIAGLASAADRLPYFTGAGTAGLATYSAFARTLADDADALTSRATLGLIIGTDVQAFDSDLGALAANATNGLWTRTAAGTGAARTLTGTANQVIISNGDGVAGNPTFTLPQSINTAASVVFGDITVGNIGLHVFDTDASHDLIFKPGSNVTADRTLTFTTGDANRTLTINADSTLSGTNTGDQTITLTGDVTGSGTGSFAATIANDAVTLAKMANIATDRLLGRDTAATGDPEVLTVGNGLEFTGAGGIGIANDGVTYARIQNVTSARVLGRTTAGAGDAEELPITGTGNVVFSAAPTFTGTITHNGGQIAFPAAQSASAGANTLDDYEENTFLPTITFGGASVGVTYSVQVGQYVKIGKLVSIQLFLQLSNKGSSAGVLEIGSLPFAVENVANYYIACSLNYDNFTYTNTLDMVGFIRPNTTAVAFVLNSGGTFSAYLANTHTNNTSQIQASCNYRTDN